MEKAIIFGAGITGMTAARELKKQYEVLCFWDNNPKVQGTYVEGIPVQAPEVSIACNAVFICTTSGMEEAAEQLLRMGIRRSQIRLDFVLTRVRARENFLFGLAELQAPLPGSVAEVGVYRGEFAKHINRAYPGRTLHLFDTFTGFAQGDMLTEKAVGASAFAQSCDFSNTGVELVHAKLPHPEQAIFHTGFFPDTAVGIEDSFCFINLDLDLYEPTLQALRFFSRRMVSGGVILLHDYDGEAFPNVKKAVADYEREKGLTLRKLHIGDRCSLAILFA